jgi:hypothetical protein
MEQRGLFTYARVVAGAERHAHLCRADNLHFIEQVLVLGH